MDVNLVEVIEALVGLTGSAIWAKTRKKRAMQAFTLGIALTALFVAVSSFSYQPDRPVEPPDKPAVSVNNLAVDEERQPATEDGTPFQVFTETITAHTDDRGHLETRWSTEQVFTMPSVPDRAEFFPLEQPTCPRSSVPLLAWREIVVSHPSLDVLYSADVRLEGRNLEIGLRAREGSRGYVYIDVSLLCHRRQDR